ncbi:hypothetical protein EH549_11920 [Staphylococcus pseudintermedius]|uniref:hypothetical protein n=1 Tax=Staphylococcus pseudintermedius TaxID=283734 RepID=UPI000C1B887A|nr:hypothetical protein [Staphylococcus pseudintermedius]EGQ4316563.1 hypothetical protein [Staphylococcus pseudintermedius]EGQ4349754.1 hypothetical protein [Staphylococcus pseudintermedius]EGQ4356931.1 hypothetical protein [Staphylococcus pseudintermedius]MBM0310693.1 hypothetical protein [Staphylococcus pseudintermedius]
MSNFIFHVKNGLKHYHINVQQVFFKRTLFLIVSRQEETRSHSFQKPHKKMLLQVQAAHFLRGSN